MGRFHCHLIKKWQTKRPVAIHLVTTVKMDNEIESNKRNADPTAAVLF